MNRHLHNDDLRKLAEDILVSYRDEPKIHRIGDEFLPSRDKIVEILSELRQLLFPGFFGTLRLTDENVGYHVGDLLFRLAGDLTEQIRQCFCMDRHSRQCPDPAARETDAGGVAHAFVARLPAIRRALALDAQAAYDGDPAARSIDEVVYCYPGFFAVTVYRIARELFALGVPLMPRIMAEHAHSITGTDIHPGARIGESFFIDHATGVIIGETTEIGDNVKIYQGVTLGAKSIAKDERGRAIKGLKRHPTIEDNVTVYPNSTILGGDTVIGRGVTIGGNSYITDSAEAHSLVTHEASMRVRTKPARHA